MTGLFYGMIAALAFCVPAASNEQRSGPDSAAALSDPGSREARALVMARLMAPEDLIVDREMILAKQAYRARTGADPRARRLEARYPGLHAAVWADAEPELRRLASGGKPRLWSRFAARLGALLTSEQIEALIIFYSTPIGRRIVAVAVGAVDSYPDDSRPAATPRTMRVEALTGELGTLTPEDSRALVTAHRAIGRDRLKLLGEEMRLAARAWRAESEPRQQALGDRILDAAMARQIARRAQRR